MGDDDPTLRWGRDARERAPHPLGGLGDREQVRAEPVGDLHPIAMGVQRVAESHDEGVIVLLGDPAYYGRFGFVAGAELGILAPDPAWGEYFQALRLAAATDAHRGGFRYARPFDEL